MKAWVGVSNDGCLLTFQKNMNRQRGDELYVYHTSDECHDVFVSAIQEIEYPPGDFFPIEITIKRIEE